MKKFIFSLLAMAAFVSCDVQNDPIGPDINTEDQFSYYGTVTVKGGMPYVSDPDSPVNFVIHNVDIESKTLDLQMVETKFNQYMPPLTMDANDIPFTTVGEAIMIQAASIIPSIKGAQQSDREMTNINGAMSGNDLTIEFDCMGLNVSYEGTSTENVL